MRERGDDVTQDIFLNIFRAVAQLAPSKGSTKVWLLKYAYRRAIRRRQCLNTHSFYFQESNGIVLWGNQSFMGEEPGTRSQAKWQRYFVWREEEPNGDQLLSHSYCR